MSEKIINTQFVLFYNTTGGNATLISKNGFDYTKPDKITKISDLNITNDITKDPLTLTGDNVAYELLKSITLKKTIITTPITSGTGESYKIMTRKKRGLMGTMRLEYGLEKTTDSTDSLIMVFAGVRGPYIDVSGNKIYVADLTGSNSSDLKTYELELGENTNINELFDGEIRSFIVESDAPEGVGIGTCKPHIKKKPTPESQTATKSSFKYEITTIPQAWAQASAIANENAPYSELFSASSYIEFVGHDKDINKKRTVPITNSDFYSEEDANEMIADNMPNGVTDHNGSGMVVTAAGTVISYSKTGYIEISDSGTRLSNVLYDDASRTKNMGLIGVRSFELDALDMVPSSNVVMPTPRVMPDLNWVYKSCSAIINLATAGIYIGGKIATHIEDVKALNTAIANKNK